jgi:2-dehydro-3-deoxyphosphooctonate aldolase (KDO 8-P synthase)
MKLCGFEAGLQHPFFLIAGPCVIENEAMTLSVAERTQTNDIRSKYKLYF